MLRDERRRASEDPIAAQLRARRAPSDRCLHLDRRHLERQPRPTRRRHRRRRAVLRRWPNRLRRCQPRRRLSIAAARCAAASSPRFARGHGRRRRCRRAPPQPFPSFPRAARALGGELVGIAASSAAARYGPPRAAARARAAASASATAAASASRAAVAAASRVAFASAAAFTFASTPRRYAFASPRAPPPPPPLGRLPLQRSDRFVIVAEEINRSVGGGGGGAGFRRAAGWSPSPRGTAAARPTDGVPKASARSSTTRH